MFLRGEKLILRAVEPKDLVDRHKWLNDREVTLFFTNLGSRPLSTEDLKRWYEERGCAAGHNEMHFSLTNLEGEHIGGAQIKKIDWRNRSAELGIFIGKKEEWGKGHCTEAMNLLLAYTFNTLNLHRLYLRVDSENSAAIRCYEKVGFRREGIVRDEIYREGGYHDVLILSILENEYRQSSLEKAGPMIRPETEKK